MATFFTNQNDRRKTLLFESQKQIVCRTAGSIRPSELLSKAPTKAIRSAKFGTVTLIVAASKINDMVDDL